MNSVNTPDTSQNFRGRFITLRPKTDKPFKWPDVQTLLLSTEYMLIEGSPTPHDPEIKMTGIEFEKEIDSFIDYFKNNLTGKTVEFSKRHPMKYNIKNGLIAVYSDDRVSVSKIPCIWEETLITIGYTKDRRLVVPFANGEAYYDQFRDELHAIW